MSQQQQTTDPLSVQIHNDAAFVNKHLSHVDSNHDDSASSPGINTSSVVFNDASIRDDASYFSGVSVGGGMEGGTVGMHGTRSEQTDNFVDEPLSPALFRRNGAREMQPTSATTHDEQMEVESAESNYTDTHPQQTSSHEVVTQAKDMQHASSQESEHAAAPSQQNDTYVDAPTLDDMESTQEADEQEEDSQPAFTPFTRHLCFPSSSTFNSLTKNIFGFSKIEQTAQETPTGRQDVCTLSEKRESLSIVNCLLLPIQNEQDVLTNLSILNQRIKETLQKVFAENSPLFQLRVLKYRTDFTQQVAMTLEIKNKRNQLAALKKLKSDVDANVNQRLQLSESLGGVEKKVHETLFVLSLKHRSIVDQLLVEQKKKLLTPALPMWKNELKFFVENGNVVVRLKDSAMYYMWEYVNPCRPLVQTRTMDEAFNVCMQSWANYRLLVVRGDVGVSSVLQNFAQSVGYHPIVKDCTKFSSWDEIVKALAGVLSSSGCLILQNLEHLLEVPSKIHGNALAHLCRVMDEVRQTLTNKSAQVEIGQFAFQITGPFLVMGALLTTAAVTKAPYPDCEAVFYNMIPFRLEEIVEVALLQKNIPAAQVASFATGLVQFLPKVAQMYQPMPHYDLGLRETLAVIEALEVTNSKKLNHSFYAALTQVHLPKLCKADVTKFNQAITKWLKKCQAPKPTQEELVFTNALPSTLSALHKLKLQQLHYLLERRPTILLCKDASLVASLSQVFLDTYTQVYGTNTKVMLHNTTRSTRKSYVVGKRNAPHPMSELLKEAYAAHKNNTPHRTVIAFRGYIKSAWFSALQGIFDFNAISFANAERIAIAPSVRFLFATSSEELSESLSLYYFGKCAIVYVD